ncbi:MAG: hypothetical protein EBU31_00235 [Proteobacteria bacterium]|nr:hypothetical protein [Pseudomonadota bacterium]
MAIGRNALLPEIRIAQAFDTAQSFDQPVSALIVAAAHMPASGLRADQALILGIVVDEIFLGVAHHSCPPSSA